MEITKTIKATLKEIEFLFETSGQINLKYYEAKNSPDYIGNWAYENEKYSFKCIFRIPEELKEEIKCEGAISGNYVAYCKTKEEVDEIMKTIKRGEAFLSDADWEVESEEVYDTFNDELFYENVEVKKLN